MSYNCNFFFLKISNVANDSILGEQEKEPISVKVENCNENFCEVKRNIPSKMEVTFAPDSEATVLSAAVHAQVAGQWIPWSIGSQSKVCDNLTKGECPLAPNDQATYELSVKIPIIAPIGLKTIVQIRISDQNKKVAACTRFPVQVVA